MIDNSELIKPLFYFNENNMMFFHCQIVRRTKDHVGKKVKEKTINSYFIRSENELNQLMPEIRLLCDFYGARAYINVAGKDFSKVNKLMLVKIATFVNDGIEGNSKKVLTSCAEKTKSSFPLWLIDIDTKDKEFKETVYNWLKAYFDKNNNGESWLKAIIPTVQGCHFIVRPFYLFGFSKEFPDIMVHRNSGTLLYMPDLNENNI